MNGCASDPGWAGCIATVLEHDAYCGCTLWDSFCVDEALMFCGMPCAIGGR